MANISRLVLEFKEASELPTEDGLKFCVFRIVDSFIDGGEFIGYDYGFANFNNGEFEELQDAGMFGTVVKWCELPNTKLLF